MMWLASFFLGSSGNWAKTTAIVALASLVSFGVGNYIATQKAVRVAAEIAAEQTAQLHANAERAIIAQHQEFKLKLAADQAAAHDADMHVHETLASAMDEAERSRDAALRQLARERHNSKEIADAYMAMVDSREAAPACGWSADARRVLNAAVGTPASANRATGTRVAEANAAGGASGALAATAEPSGGLALSCDQLFRGYADLAKDDRVVRAREAAWRAWYQERFERDTHR